MFRARRFTRLFVPAGISIALLSTGYVAEGATFTPVGNMAGYRAACTATTLASGSVLVVGGSTWDRQAELYDPVSRGFIPTGELSGPRNWHAAVMLSDGNVLILGGGLSGTAYSSTELYFPDDGTFWPIASMTVPRVSPTATLLGDGSVLVTGGAQSSSSITWAEFLDPVDGTFSPTANSMMENRQNHTATLLGNGKVLIVGGYRSGVWPLSVLRSAELFDPASRTFSPTGSLAFGRAEHTATLLPDGKVLVAGGFDAAPGQALASAELYDPATGQFVATGSLGGTRGGHSATLLRDGTVLVAGGFPEFPMLRTMLATAEIYRPWTKSFSATASMSSGRGRHVAAPLSDGGVLVLGGPDENGNGRNGAEVYFDETTATTISLLAAEASRDHVELAWRLADATPGAEAVLSRSDSESEWVRLAGIVPDGTGRLEYEDRDVVAGGRYGYRLSVQEAGTERIASEVWVDVPMSRQLALEGVRFTPASQSLRVSFVLADAQPARIDLLDIGGRRLTEHEVGSLGAGAHTLDLTEGAGLPSGLYLVRLRSGASTLVAKAVVAR